MVLISYQSPPWLGWPLWNICHRWPWIRPTCSWLISGFVIRLTRRVLIVEQEMITIPEHLSSPPVFGGVRITRSLVWCLYFVDRFLCFCSFSFGHCVLCPSIYGSDYSFGIFKIFLRYMEVKTQNLNLYFNSKFSFFYESLWNFLPAFGKQIWPSYFCFPWYRGSKESTRDMPW